MAILITLKFVCNQISNLYSTEKLFRSTWAAQVFNLYGSLFRFSHSERSTMHCKHSSESLRDNGYIK